MTKEEQNIIERAEKLIARLQRLLDEPTPKPRPILAVLVPQRKEVKS